MPKAGLEAKGLRQLDRRRPRACREQSHSAEGGPGACHTIRKLLTVGNSWQQHILITATQRRSELERGHCESFCLQPTHRRPATMLRTTLRANRTSWRAPASRFHSSPKRASEITVEVDGRPVNIEQGSSVIQVCPCAKRENDQKMLRFVFCRLARRLGPRSLDFGKFGLT